MKKVLQIRNFQFENKAENPTIYSLFSQMIILDENTGLIDENQNIYLSPSDFQDFAGYLDFYLQICSKILDIPILMSNVKDTMYQNISESLTGQRILITYTTEIREKASDISIVNANDEEIFNSVLTELDLYNLFEKGEELKQIIERKINE